MCKLSVAEEGRPMLLCFKVCHNGDEYSVLIFSDAVHRCKKIEKSYL